MRPEEISSLIEAGLASARADVRSEDNTHFQAIVISPDFAGVRTLKRHQLIYATLGARMGAEIHALSIRAYTPEEWDAAQGGER